MSPVEIIFVLLGVIFSGIFYAIMSYFNKQTKDEIDWYKIGNASKVYFEIKK